MLVQNLPKSNIWARKNSSTYKNQICDLNMNEAEEDNLTAETESFLTESVLSNREFYKRYK